MWGSQGSRIEKVFIFSGISLQWVLTKLNRNVHYRWKSCPWELRAEASDLEWDEQRRPLGGGTLEVILENEEQWVQQTGGKQEEKVCLWHRPSHEKGQWIGRTARISNMRTGAGRADHGGTGDTDNGYVSSLTYTCSHIYFSIFSYMFFDILMQTSWYSRVS